MPRDKWSGCRQGCDVDTMAVYVTTYMTPQPASQGRTEGRKRTRLSASLFREIDLCDAMLALLWGATFIISHPSLFLLNRQRHSPVLVTFCMPAS